MITRRPPTHTLQITVPLAINASGTYDQRELEQAMAEALDTILRLVKLGTLGLLADEIEVTLTEVQL